MVVKFLQKGGEARQYATRTIFSDVPSTHWARQYINLAATYQVTKGGENASPVYLVSGVGNGKFMPDSNISMAEATTILLRALGYSGEQAGAVWPQGYMDLGASIGLTDGLSVNASAAITRAQAAQLFVNALECKTAEGEVYYKSLGGTVKEGAIVLAVNAATDDGSRLGAVRTVTGSDSQAYLPANGSGNVTALQGRRGDLVLNAQEEIVAFVPDNSTSITVTLDGAARATSVKAEGGKQYTIGKDTPVYIADAKEDSGYQDSVTYDAARGKLVSGSQLTMYAENGKIVSVFASVAGAAVGTDAVVVMGKPTAATFHRLTGGIDNFSVVRGRETIGLSRLKDYDVVTYDKANNTLIASDLRISCYYQSASPGPKNPETVKALGHEFEVMESAWDTAQNFKPGDNVVLLLTADGRVAGMAAPGGTARSTAIGFVEGSSVDMFLPNGTTMKLDGVSNDKLDSRLVTISGTRSGLTVSRLSDRGGPGDYQVSARKLGSYTVASDVRVYEQVSGGIMAPVKTDELPYTSITSDKVASYHLNASNIADVIVLNNVTGNAYQYGMMVSATETNKVPQLDKDGNEQKDSNGNVITKDVTTTSWKLVRSSGEIEFVPSSNYSGRSGDMVGVVTGTPLGDAGPGERTIKAVIQLTEVKGVKTGDFFLSEGAWYVTAAGRTYRVASDVECCYDLGGGHYNYQWLTDSDSEERLTSIRAYSDDFTVYVDPVGQQVRVVKAV